MRFFNLPYAVIGLFIFKACERFSYYATKNNMCNYLLSPDTFNMSAIDATTLLSSLYRYSLLITILAGIACDLIGQKRGLILGAILVLLGHSITHIVNIKIFMLAFILINIANGFLRSSVIATINKVIPTHLIDSVMFSFYQVFNAGAFLGTLTVGYVALFFGWKIAFLYATLVVFIGHISGATLYFYSKKYDCKTNTKNQNIKIQDNKQEFVNEIHTDKNKRLEKINSEKQIIQSDSNKEYCNKEVKIEISTWGQMFTGISLYILLHYNAFLYFILESMDMHLIPCWLSEYGTHYIGSLYLTTSAIVAFNPLMVIILPFFINKIRNLLKNKNYFTCNFLWCNIGILFMSLATLCLILAHYEKIYYGQTTPFFFVLYVIFLVIGEVIYYPILLASPAYYLSEKMYGTLLTTTAIVQIISQRIGELFAIGALKNCSTLYMGMMLIYIAITGIIINSIASRLNKSYLAGVTKKS